MIKLGISLLFWRLEYRKKNIFNVVFAGIIKIGIQYRKVESQDMTKNFEVVNDVLRAIWYSEFSSECRRRVGALPAVA